MAKKEYIGISYDNTQLRLARMQIVRKKLTLLSVSSIPLSSPLQTAEAKGLDAFQSGDSDEIFDLDIPSSPDTLDELDELDEFDKLDEFDLLDNDEEVELEDPQSDDFGLEKRDKEGRR